MPSTFRYDIAILGAGHNGLTAAAYLAKAGLRVVVVEKNGCVGGAAVTEEFHPGFRNSVAAYTVGLLNPTVLRDLDLERHGLRIVERPAANFWPVDNERYLLMPYGTAARQNAIAKFSKKDAERLPFYEASLERAAVFLRDLLLRTPPGAGAGLLELLGNADLGIKLIGLSLEDRRLLTDLFTKSAEDFLNLWFESDVVKGAFAFDGIVGAYAAPSTPGTAYVLLHHCFGVVNGKSGVWGHAIGGMGAITQAMARSALSAGAEIRVGELVVKVDVQDGRAAGLILESGEKISALAVAVNVPPKLLFRDLLPEQPGGDDLRHRIMTMKTGSGTFRMNVALTELPNFTCRPGIRQCDHHGAGIIIGPEIGYLERAYLDAKTFGWSQQPVVEMVIPSTIDDSLAPPGRHVASLFVQHVAPTLPGGRSWENPCEKETFADLVIDTVSRYAPNFKSSVIARQILSPLDLERRFGLIDGDIFHGQLSLDQLFSLRPVFGHADYRLGVPGLYLCGSGAHPGGGVTGAPGYNAAREILRDFSWYGRSKSKFN